MNVLDLFSGIGGFSLGLERAGMRTVAFCEIEPYARAVLRRHWPTVPIFDDVRALTAEALADAAGVDLICGGFPCQDISLAGKGAGITGSRSGLWSEFARLIGEIRPRYVIVENVAALLGRGLERVLGDLAALGFDAEWHCIPACAVGAPHRRDRVWIVAYPNSGRCEVERQQEYSEQQRASGHQPDGCGEAGWWNGENVANAADSGYGGQRNKEAGQRQSFGNGVHVPNARPQLLERWGRESGEGSTQWLVEPDVGRVANGVPSRVDRLRSLGNAVVPQVVEIIGRAIMAARSQGRVWTTRNRKEVMPCADTRPSWATG